VIKLYRPTDVRLWKLLTELPLDPREIRPGLFHRDARLHSSDADHETVLSHPKEALRELSGKPDVESALG
jgi:hypothetical protein